MFSQEKLNVQSLCISPCFQWPVSPLKTRSCCTQNKNFSFLNLKLFLFFSTAIGCLPIPGTLRWNILAHYFSHNPAWNRVGFSKEGLNLRKTQWKRTGNAQAADKTLQLTLLTDNSYSFPFLFLHFWKEAQCYKGLKAGKHVTTKTSCSIHMR